MQRFHPRDLTGLVPQPVRFAVRKAIFRGHAETCPLCLCSVSGYRAHGSDIPVLTNRRVVGGMRKENDRCPVCHARDRTRLMAHYLDRHGGLGRDGLRVLHVAPDFGLYLWLIRHGGLRYTACDIDASRYRHIKGTVTADLTRTPFEAGSFDIVICSHVLEHIPEDRAAMAEVLRILKPGGMALLLVPLATDGGETDEDPTVTERGDRVARFGQWDHVRLYERSDFLSRLREVGFEVELFEPAQSDPASAQSWRLNPLEGLPVARRPAD